MKRMMAIALCAVLCLWQMPTAQAVGTSASSAVLVEAESGRVLYEQNSHEPRLIASITKLMTALVALESGCGLQETFVVPQEAVGVEGSSIYLRPGEETTLEALLYGLMLKSGNDAALAIAIRCGGSVEQFVAAMNQKAQELGMKDTHFANPNGLNAEDHYSSAYDMALLARACLKNETLSKIVSTKSITIGQRSLTNHNKLLWRYEGCIGMKTGYTEKAGRTLVSAAERDGMTLIAVTLNDPDDWKDHTALLDWGFSHYTLVHAVQQGAKVGKLPVSGSLLSFVDAVASQSYSYPVGSEDQMSLSLKWTAQELTAPVKQGERLGSLTIFCNGEAAAEIPLVAACTVQANLAPKRNWFQHWGQLIG